MAVLWRVALAFLLVRQESPSAPDARGLLRQALHAVEEDSVTPFARPWSRALARDSSDRAALLVLGSLARLTYDYPKADSLLSRVTARDTTDALADYALMEMAASFTARGRFREGAAAYSRAVAGAERRGDSTTIAEALVGLAGPRARLVAPAEVLPLLDRAGALTGGDVRLDAAVRCQRAALWSRLGRPGARQLADSGAAAARRAQDLRAEARCLHVAAQALAGTGDMGGAAEVLGRAAELFRRSRDRASLAAVLQWRGYLQVTVGHDGTARDLLMEAVAEGERAQAMSPVGWALVNLGQISLYAGDPAAAVRDLTRAAALLEAQGDEWGTVTALTFLGTVSRYRGDREGARAAYARTLAWGERSGDVLTRFTSHNALASLNAEGGDWPGAVRELEAARAVARDHRMTGWEESLHYGAGVLALRQGDLGKAERELRAYLAVTDTNQRDTRYRTRALLAEVHVARGDIGRAEVEIQAASRELDEWRALLPEGDLRVRAFQGSEYGGDRDLGVATVIAALARAERTQVAYELAERRRARALTDRIRSAQAMAEAPAPGETVFGVDSTGGIALVDDSTALLEYVTGRRGEPTTVFIVSAAGMTSRELEPIDSLAGDIHRFMTLLEGGGDVGPLGARLGGALLDPAMGALASAVTQLIIVPDDILARLPFDALILADGRYVVERFAVGLAPSAAAVSALRTRARPAGAVRLLAFGDPRFARSAGADTQTTDGGTATYRSAFDDAGGLARLPATAREAKRVARYADAADVRLRDRASEAFLRAAPLGSFRVLHFATHALVDETAVTRTALALSPGDGHDGFVGPGDLAGLPLNADLVVLSACRTAGGELVGGEGIQGLTAPLLQAGARAVVATAWRIADATTGPLIEAFYRELAAGRTVSAALRETKLSALRRGAPPSEWAAFVVVGDPAARVPLVMPAERATGPIWLVGAVLLLAAAAYGWSRRKRRGSAAA